MPAPTVATKTTHGATGNNPSMPLARAPCLMSSFDYGPMIDRHEPSSSDWRSNYAAQQSRTTDHPVESPCLFNATARTTKSSKKNKNHY